MSKYLRVRLEGALRDFGHLPFLHQPPPELRSPLGLPAEGSRLSLAQGTDCKKVSSDFCCSDGPPRDGAPSDSPREALEVAVGVGKDPQLGLHPVGHW
jgi:hypothetical protein